MESDKENAKKNTLTRIPVPVDPLPAIPQHLLKMKSEVNEVRRVPLGTLMQSNCKPSSSKACTVPEKRKKFSIKTLDTRHVTLRHQYEDIDQDYKEFKDIKSETTLSSDEENDKRDVEMKIVGDCVGPRLVATPTGKFLEPKGVRNVKRSLKRPHSRELQGLTPAQKQEKIDEKAKRKLFNESLEDRLLSPDYWKKAYMTCMNRDYTEDVFKHLLNVERKPLDVPKTTSSITRACVINWLMKVNGPNGNPATVQAACWYLDSLLSTGNVKLNKLQLAATACYCIAMKLHGPVISAYKLVKCSNNAFSAVELMAAEKMILQRLKFPVQPVVPQEFITYLAWCCDNSHPGEIEVAATFLCLSGLMVDKRLCEEYPSVIAAAAIRNALLLLGKQELMPQLELFPLYKAAAKKTANIVCICSVQRKAVRTIGANIYEYKAPLEHYGQPPNYIAQRIIDAANDIAVFDTRVYPSKRDSISFKF